MVHKLSRRWANTDEIISINFCRQSGGTKINSWRKVTCPACVARGVELRKRRPQVYKRSLPVYAPTGDGRVRITNPGDYATAREREKLARQALLAKASLEDSSPPTL